MINNKKNKTYDMIWPLSIQPFRPQVYDTFLGELGHEAHQDQLEDPVHEVLVAVGV